MKIIPKFQKGGSYSSLFAVYTPVSVQQPQRVSRTSQATDTGSTKSDSQKGQLTEKDLFDMLKDIDGLPNDMQQITSNLLSTFELSNLTGLDSGSLATKYLSSLYKIKQAKFNKDEYEKAYNRAVANESLNDVAITLQGSIIVQDRESNGELKFISPEEYTDNKSKGQYIPVTNSNLLWLRANSPEYVNDFSLLQTIENGIGLNKVNEMIKERLQKLGTSEVSNETFYKKGSAVKGAELLDQMIQLGPEGYYKIKQSLTQTQKSQINAALEYIYSTLPANAKTRLRLETADGSHDQALRLINDYLLQGVSTKQDTSIDYIGTKDSSSSSTGQDPNKGFWSQVQSGQGGDDFMYTILSKNGRMSVQGKFYGTTPGLDSNKSLGDYISSSNVGHLIKNNKNITFGDTKIDINSFDDVMVSSYSGAAVVNLPIKVDGTVDLDVSRRYVDVLDKMKQYNLTPGSQEYSDKFRQLMNENQLGDLVMADGSLNKNRFCKFLILEGYTSEKAKAIQDNKPVSFKDVQSEYIVPAGDSDELYDMIRAGLSNKDRGEYDIDSGLFSDDLYKGNIYIPLNTNPISGYNADENDIKQSTSYLYEKAQQMNSTNSDEL